MPRLYFVALLPPSPVFEQIQAVKHQTSLDFGTSHALKAPAHLTIMPPFFFEEERIRQVREALKDVARDFRPFSVVLDGYKFFEPRVLFMHVLQNRSLRVLEQLVWDKLTSTFPAVEWKERQRFHPHISIATRIEDEPLFFRIQKAFMDKPFHASFPVHDMALLTWEEDHWRVAQRIPFKGPAKSLAGPETKNFIVA